MRLTLKKLLKKYSELNVFILIVVNIVIVSGLSFLMMQIPWKQDIVNQSVEALKDKSVFYAFFVIVIFGPLIETLVFQTAVIRVTLFVSEKYSYLAVFISAFLFSLVHIYSLIYVIWAFIIGIIFAYTYLLTLKRRQNPILVVFAIHAAVNFIPFSMDFL